jgi:hypothetical protein
MSLVGQNSVGGGQAGRLFDDVCHGQSRLSSEPFVVAGSLWQVWKGDLDGCGGPVCFGASQKGGAAQGT